MNRKVIDMMGREVYVPTSPQRIVSLVPSQTELLVVLGLEKRIVGVTRFCIHPNHLRFDKTRVGGTKDVNLKRLRDLKPDLIIGNKEENDQAQIEVLSKEFPTWMSDVNKLEEALEMIKQLGNITSTQENALVITGSVLRAFDGLQKLNTQRKVLYLIWKDPYMAAGRSTFIDDLLNRCGLVNACTADRYPQLTMEEIKSLKPDLIFLSSEPYPFKQKHYFELESQLPGSKVKLVDGEYFSWYGSRLLKASDYFNKLLREL